MNEIRPLYVRLVAASARSGLRSIGEVVTQVLMERILNAPRPGGILLQLDIKTLRKMRRDLRDQLIFDRGRYDSIHQLSIENLSTAASMLQITRAQLKRTRASYRLIRNALKVAQWREAANSTPDPTPAA